MTPTKPTCRSLLPSLLLLSSTTLLPFAFLLLPLLPASPALAQTVPDRRAELIRLNNLGLQLYNQGRYQEALAALNQALIIVREIKNRRGEGAILNNMGRVYASLGQYAKALEKFTLALAILRAVGDRSVEATVLNNIASVHYRQGNLPAALAQVQQAVKIIEAQRASLSSLEQRTAYFATQQNPFELYIDVLMALHRQAPQQGYDAQAFHVSERARARSLIELFSTSQVDLDANADPRLVAEKQALEQDLRTVKARRTAYLQANRPDANPDQWNADLQQFEKEEAAISQKLNELDQRICVGTPDNCNLRKPLTLAEVQQQVLDEDIVLL